MRRGQRAVAGQGSGAERLAQTKPRTSAHDPTASCGAAKRRGGWGRSGRAQPCGRDGCERGLAADRPGAQHAAAAGAQQAHNMLQLQAHNTLQLRLLCGHGRRVRPRLHDMLDRCRANEPRGAHVPGDVTGGRETSPLDMAKSFDPNSGKTGFCTHRTHEPAGRRRCHDDAADVRPRSRPRPAPAFPAEYSAGQQCKQGHRNVLCHNLPDARYAQQRSSVDDAQIRSRLPAGAPRHDGSAWRATRVLKAHCMVL